jgi:hypothetical protein
MNSPLRVFLALIAFVLTCAVPASAARKIEFTNLRTMMSADEFRAAGLEKLSPEELAALDVWLQRATGNVVQEARTETREKVRDEEREKARAEQREKAQRNFGRETPAEGEEAIESRILGRFTGWEGNTVFILENGQVWKQRDTSNVYQPVTDPKVTIRKSAFGYRMSVEGIGPSVGVTRVK